MKYYITLIMFSLSIATISRGQDTLTIRQIQEVPPGGDISPYNGQPVYTGGEVTAGTSTFYEGISVSFYMSDPGGGEFSGIKVYSPILIGFPILTPGDSVLCYGQVTDDGMTTLNVSAQELSIRRHRPPIEPLRILAREIDPYTGGDSLAEKYEAVFVRINNPTVDSTIEFSNTSRWYCHDYSGNFIVKEESDSISFVPSTGQQYSYFQGVVDQIAGLYLLKPRLMSDLVIDRPCNYILGDVNASGAFNGVDVVYGVNYFKGSPAYPRWPCLVYPPDEINFVAGDVNGNCTFNGIDITYSVNIFKGRADPIINPCFPSIAIPPYCRINGIINPGSFNPDWNTYLVADSLDSDGLRYPWTRNLCEQNRDYYLLVSPVDSPRAVLLHAFCDLRNDNLWEPEIGEGWGYYDGNGNNIWDLGDTLMVYPGELIQGIDITLEEFQPGTSILLDK
jgi:hypothetical protein